MSANLSTVLSTQEAEELTTFAVELYADVATGLGELRAIMLKLYEGGAHTALGYASWAAYGEERFGKSKAQLHHLLREADVAHQIQSDQSDWTPSAIRTVARKPKAVQKRIIDAVASEPVVTPKKVTELLDSWGRPKLTGPMPKGMQSKARGDRHCPTCTCYH